MDLFHQTESDKTSEASVVPLAERTRPRSLDEFVGQAHLVGAEGVLRKQLASGTLGSMIFWGPPGCGKTTLARIAARESGAQYHQISAVTAGVKDVKKIIDAGIYNRKSRGKKTILFIDEIHRFNKAQQDVLLKSVEEGDILLIGATTENPSFEVISPLLSRCRIYRLTPLNNDELSVVLRGALAGDDTLKNLNPVIDETTLSVLIDMSGGDARIMLNACEAAVRLVDPDSSGKRVVTPQAVEHVLQQKSRLYDKHGEYHYDIISAFIKSLRGSDPDAGAYWLVRMLESGEDPKFIARRMIILASEDIGNADPRALPLATAAFTAVDYVGMPEAQLILMHTATYLASTAKSNSAVGALSAAKKALKEHPDSEVPLHLRNAPTRYMASEGYGKGYKYPHDYPEHFTHQDYLPEALSRKVLYRPADTGVEKRLRERLNRLWGARKDSR